MSFFYRIFFYVFLVFFCSSIVFCMLCTMVKKNKNAIKNPNLSLVLILSANPILRYGYDNPVKKFRILRDQGDFLKLFSHSLDIYRNVLIYTPPIQSKLDFRRERTRFLLTLKD